MTKIKPCPFCGGEAHTTEFRNPIDNIHAVQCDCCAAAVCAYNEADAIEFWNERVDEAKEEPDSWDKLERDIFASIDSSSLVDWEALGIGGINAEIVKDFVRRAKELVGR